VSDKVFVKEKSSHNSVKNTSLQGHRVVLNHPVHILRLTSDGQLCHLLAISEIPKKPVSLIESLNKVGCQARESVPLLCGICASYRIRNLIRSRELQRSR